MDSNWAPLVPTTKTSSAASSGLNSVINTRHNISATEHNAAQTNSNVNNVSLDPFAIGSLPSTVVQRILSFVPVSDLPSCALAARSLARFVADDRLWAQKLASLQYKQIPGRHLRYNPDLSTVASSRSAKDQAQPPNRKNSTGSNSNKPSNTPSSTTFDSNDDDFGDFEAATITSPDDESFGGFVSSKPNQSGQSFSSAPVFSYRAESKLPVPSTEPDSAYQTFKRIAVSLKPFVQSLLFETSPTTSLVFTDPSLSSLASQAYMICNVARFTGPHVLGSFAKPILSAASDSGGAPDAPSDASEQDQWRLRMSIREAADYLEGVLLSAFEGADARRADALRAGERGMDVAKSVERAESDMHEHATLIWNLAISTADESASSTNLLFGGTIPAEGENTHFLATLDHPGSAAALSFLEKRDGLFKSTTHRPEANFATSASQSRPALDFTAMDAFMADVLSSLTTDGSLVARVFPPEQQVLLAFASRIANEVVGEYIDAVLTKARSVDTHLYLQAAAATFSQALKIADTLEKIEPRHADFVTAARCRSIVLSMFEAHLDEYLQEERDWVRSVMMDMCHESDGASGSTRNSASAGRVKATKTMETAFLASSNPAQVKRNVLSGFKDVLLMPVTVVPRAAGAVGGAVIRTAGTGLSQLNPLKWQQSSAGARNASGASSVLGTPQRSTTPAVGSNDVAANNGYVDFSKEVLGGPDGHVVGDDDSDEEEGFKTSSSMNEKLSDFGGFAEASGPDEWNEKRSGTAFNESSWEAASRVDRSVDAGGWGANGKEETTPKAGTASNATSARAAEPSEKQSSTEPDTEPSAVADRSRFARLQLLLSLDTALSLIQVNRESLKRMEAFLVYPANTANGRRVKEEMEEVCLSLFQVLGEQHIAPGFNKATDEIKQWNPLSDNDTVANSEKAVGQDEGAAAEVLPLVQFFELSHIADTISQLCSVYFAQTLVPVVKLDVDDFLNPVVRAKKAFEGNLDEFVAGGLSVSVDLLMKRAEWILFSQRDPLDYAGTDVSKLAELDSSTQATRSTIEVLRFHCSLLVGATDREILDLFHTEVALRLFGILTKHLKSLQISQTGGFQLISDLNHIAAFIASLKSKDPDIPRFYNSLKTLANYYIVDGKELIALLKNKDAAATSAKASAREDGFVFGQEELYEFLKSRTDFRQIEKQVDHEIFGFKVSEDCVIA